ncbi:hypothetical protein ABEQ08_12375, partial [Cutibacterium acnes]
KMAKVTFSVITGINADFFDHGNSQPIVGVQVEGDDGVLVMGVIPEGHTDDVITANLRDGNFIKSAPLGDVPLAFIAMMSGSAFLDSAQLDGAEFRELFSVEK